MDHFIVAEISKNWPSRDDELISKKFERVINTNLERGYRLHSFQLHRVVTPADVQFTLNETIIAVFERIAS